jgi:hypothetical protein
MFRFHIDSPKWHLSTTQLKLLSAGSGGQVPRSIEPRRSCRRGDTARDSISWFCSRVGCRDNQDMLRSGRPISERSLTPRSTQFPVSSVLGCKIRHDRSRSVDCLCTRRMPQQGRGRHGRCFGHRTCNCAAAFNLRCPSHPGRLARLSTPGPRLSRSTTTVTSVLAISG